MTTFDYVLVTAARNEEKFIASTLQSVVQQTILPRKWAIVSDGSTDRTDEIVSDFAREYAFISLVRSSASGARSFGAKVRAFRMGHEQLRNVSYDYVGNLDADVSFAPDYFERVFRHFQRIPKLGIGGGIIHELISGTFVPQRTSLNSVAGAVQMFRRRCYEEIGGYVPLRYGCIDSAAEIMTRMHGWEVLTFADIAVRHHRRVSSGTGSMLKTIFRHGLGHHSIGYHPLFEVLRNAYGLTDRPYVLGSLLTTLGYFWAVATRKEPGLPKEVVTYLRSEQMERLLAMCRRGSLEAHAVGSRLE